MAIALTDWILLAMLLASMLVGLWRGLVGPHAQGPQAFAAAGAGRLFALNISGRIDFLNGLKVCVELSALSAALRSIS